MSVGVYAGLFTSGVGGYSFWSTSSWDSSVNQYNSLAGGSTTLVSIDTHQDDAQTTYYTGAWADIGSQGAYLWRTTDWSSFINQFNSNSGSLRLQDIDVHASAGFRYYTGTWGGSPIKQTIVNDLSWADFQTQWKTLSSQGMRLAKIQIYPSETRGQFHVTGLFEQAAIANEAYDLLITTNYTQFTSYYQARVSTQQLTDFQFYDDDDKGARYYVGVWRQLSSSSVKQQFVQGLSYNDFVNQWTSLSNQGYRLRKSVKYSSSVMVPQPSWDTFFKTNLASNSQGYAYSVLKEGKVVASGVSGNARNAHDTPQTTFSLDTRLHMASVSKTVTGVAVLKILADKGIGVDAPFWDPYMKKQIPTVGTNVDKITIRQLLNMKSGMNDDIQAIWFSDYWGTVKSYLGKQNVPADAPGKTYQYSNTNFLILQAFVDCLLGNDGNSATNYPQYVASTILKPMGVDTSLFSTAVDPSSRSTLYYTKGTSSSETGYYYSAVQNVGGSGWVGSTRQLSNFMAGVRLNTVLPANTTANMIAGSLGWDSDANNYIYEGLYGRYYHKNGALFTAANTGQGLWTGIVRLSHGYDAVVVTNSNAGDVVPMIIQAFEQRS